MKTLFAAILLTGAALGAAQAEDWKGFAAQDVQAIHDALRDNSPAAVVDRDSATFKAWLDSGVARQGSASVSGFNNAAAYVYAVRGYTGGFRDSSIDILPNWAAPDPAFAATWPGFSTTWRNGAYVVAGSTGGKTPPNGAKLVACDKKPADAFARERLDRWDGDLNQEADRFRTAPYLLWDRANPFIPALPLKCDFEVNGRKKSFNITPDFQNPQGRAAAYRAAAPKPQGLSVEQLGAGWRVNMHSFSDQQDWQAFFGQLETNRDAIRAAPFVVIDMRGAAEGAARNGYQAANRIWAPEFVLNATPQPTNVAYRVSPANRAYYAGVATRLRNDPMYTTTAPRWEALVAQMDQAATAGQSTLQVNESVPAPTDVPANPVAGKVYILTDYWCTAACLDMMDLFTKLPNVTQIGTATGTNSIFVGKTEVALPSGQARLTFGTKAWLDRPRGSSTAYTPATAYTGDLADEAAITAWLTQTAR